MSGRPPVARGDVVLVLFPFADLSGAKVRPSVVLARPGPEVIVAFVTSRRDARLTPAEHLLEPTDAEFGASGLREASVVHADKVATVDRRLLQRRLGRVGPRTSAALDRCLRYVFAL